MSNPVVADEFPVLLPFPFVDPPVVTDEFPLLFPFQFVALPTIPTDFGRRILTAPNACAVLSLLGITLGVDGGDSGSFDDPQAVDGGAPSGFDDLIFDGGIPGTWGAFPFNFSFSFPTETPAELTVVDGGDPGSSGPVISIGTTTVDGGSPQC